MFPTCAAIAFWLIVPPITRLEWERLATVREAVAVRRGLLDAGICFPGPDFWHRVNDQHAIAVRRLAELERHWDRSPAGRLAAARNWYLLAREHELFLTSQAERGLLRDTDRLAPRLHRLDAELELNAALATLPASALPVLAPLTPAPADLRATVTEVNGGWVFVTGSKTGRLKRFERLVLERPQGPVELAVLEPADPDGRAAAIVLPTAAGVSVVRVGDQLQP